MAFTEITTNLKETIWGSSLWRATIHAMAWTKYMGTSTNNIVVITNEFLKQAGDTLRIGISYPLESEGVDGDGPLIGNEEELKTYDFSFQIDQKRNGVRLKGKMSEKRTRLNLRREARDRLSLWLSEMIDKDLTWKASGTTTATFANTPTAPTDLYYGGDAGNNDTPNTELAASDWLGTNEIDRMKIYAQTRYPKIKPLDINGAKWYVMQIHPYHTYKLKQDTTYSAAQKDAMPRGTDNPLFTGAVGAWNGVLLHENEFLPTITLNSLACKRALLFGQEAMVLGFGGAVEWGEDTTSDQADYGNRPGFETGRIWGCQKVKFNGKDNGCIAMDAYAPVPTGTAHS